LRKINKIGISITHVNSKEIKNLVSNSILTTFSKEFLEEARDRFPKTL
jgi:hypothetical protein